MSSFDWGYPNTVWFGNGRIKDLPKACKILNIKKPLFVTDQDLAKTKMVGEKLCKLAPAQRREMLVLPDAQKIH